MRLRLFLPALLLAACGSPAPEAPDGGDDTPEVDAGVGPDAFPIEDEIDETFGQDGQAWLEGPIVRRAFGVGIDADANGRIYVGGADRYGYGEQFLCRLTADGDRDDWNDDGCRDVADRFGIAFAATPAGVVESWSLAYEPGPAHLTRFTDGGAMDTTFGVEGTATLPPDRRFVQLMAADGGDLVLTTITPDNVFSVLRVDAAGDVVAQVDRTYEGGAAGYDLAAHPAGGWVVMVAIGSATALMRVDDDGAQITEVPLPSGTPPGKLAVQADGKILLVTWQGVTRFLASGEVDVTFADGGTLAPPCEEEISFCDRWRSIEQLADGRFAVGGDTFGRTAAMSLASLRVYAADGVLDTGFAGDGEVEWPTLPGFDWPPRFAIDDIDQQPDGSLLVLANDVDAEPRRLFVSRVVLK